MSLEEWERKVLSRSGAPERVKEIEDELDLASGLTALRVGAGVTQREVAERMGVSQPSVVAIEQASNVTVSLLEKYVAALGGRLNIAAEMDTGQVVLATSRSAAAVGSPPPIRGRR